MYMMGPLITLTTLTLDGSSGSDLSLFLSPNLRFLSLVRWLMANGSLQVAIQNCYRPLRFNLSIDNKRQLSLGIDFFPWITVSKIQFR